MKMKRMFMILLCAVLLLSGCSSEHTSFIQVSCAILDVESEGEYTFCFYVSCFDNKEDYPVELLAIEGTNTDKVEFSMKDTTHFFEKDRAVKKGYFHYYMVECTANVDDVSINKLVLRVKGEKVEVEPRKPISIIRTVADQGHCLGITGYPIAIFTDSLKQGQEYTYYMSTQEEITLTSVSFSGILMIKDAVILKNRTVVGTLEENLPFKMHPGDEYAIQFVFDYDEDFADGATYYDTFSTTIHFRYFKNEDADKTLNYRLGLSGNSTMEKETLNEYIEAIIGGSR